MPFCKVVFAAMLAGAVTAMPLRVVGSEEKVAQAIADSELVGLWYDMGFWSLSVNRDDAGLKEWVAKSAVSKITVLNHLEFDIEAVPLSGVEAFCLLSSSNDLQELIKDLLQVDLVQRFVSKHDMLFNIRMSEAQKVFGGTSCSASNASGEVF